MKYDFTTILDREGKDAIAVDGLGKMSGFAPERPKEGFDVIPMWIGYELPNSTTDYQSYDRTNPAPVFWLFYDIRRV